MPPHPCFFSETLNYWYIYGPSKTPHSVRPWLWGYYKNNNKNPPTNPPTTSLFFYLSYLPSIQMNKGAATHPFWWEAITFECQKIILAVIFSNISGTAKATNGHGGEGNDLLLLPVTVHNSISNISPFKSLRSLLMYMAHLIYVFWNPVPLLLMFAFVIQRDDMWQLKWNLLYYLPAILCPCIITLNEL